MDIFQSENSIVALSKLLEFKESVGRGQKTKLAGHLGVSSSFISQIMKGSKVLTLEQGIMISEFFNLGEDQREYFLLLVQRERSGHSQLTKFFNQKIASFKKQIIKVDKTLKVENKVSDKDKILFYSDWLYSAIFLLCSLEGYQNEDQIFKYFNLPESRVRTCLNNLLEMKVLEVSGGKILPTNQHLYLSGDDPLVYQHHKNFRLAAFNRHSQDLKDHELLLTIPLSIAKKNAPLVRKEILKLAEKLKEYVEGDEPDSLMGLNIDWYEF